MLNSRTKFFPEPVNELKEYMDTYRSGFKSALAPHVNRVANENHNRCTKRASGGIFLHDLTRNPLDRQSRKLETMLRHPHGYTLVSQLFIPSIVLQVVAV